MNENCALKYYLKEAYSYPMLTSDEEKELFEKYQNLSFEKLQRLS